MIEAFEAGVPLTAHGRETDAQAAVASMRAARMALEGMKIEEAPDQRPEQVVPREQMDVAVATNSAYADVAGDPVFHSWPLVSAPHASHRQDPVTPTFALPAMSERPPGVADTTVPADLYTAQFGNSFIDGVRDNTTPIAAPQATSHSDVPEGKRIDRLGDTLNSWIRQIVGGEAAGPHAMNCLQPADMITPLPGVYPEAPVANAEGPAHSALTFLLGGGGEHGPIVGTSSGSWPTAINATNGSLSTPDATPPFVKAAEDGEPMQSFARSPSWPDSEGNRGVLPFGSAIPDGVPARWFNPSPPASAMWSDGQQSATPPAAGVGTQLDREERGPVVVHATFHLDGSVLAHAVSEHLVGAMNGPLAGTGGFDPRRSYSPVEG